MESEDPWLVQPPNGSRAQNDSWEDDTYQEVPWNPHTSFYGETDHHENNMSEKNDSYWLDRVDEMDLTSGHTCASDLRTGELFLFVDECLQRMPPAPPAQQRIET